jgi:HK97 family phage major capsid protein
MKRTKLDDLRSDEELLAHRKVLAARLEELDEDKRGLPLDDAERAEFAETTAQVKELDLRVAEFRKRIALVRELSKRPENCEGPELASVPLGSPTMQGATRELGLRAIERHSHKLPAKSNDVLDGLVRNDPLGLAARYLDAVGDPHYAEAFGLILQHGQAAQVRMTPEQTAAVQKVSRVMAERAMAEGAGGTGGFAIPYVLDTSIIMSGSGAMNPVRQISRVITITGARDWKGVSSDGVSAAYVAEAVEATDASPTLAQPAISTAQWRVFVPFSIELGQDWAELQGELVRLAEDARSVLDATQFLTGTGSNAPGGILNIGGTGGLTTTQRVQTNTVATYAVGDPWLLGAAIPARFRASTTFAAAPGTWDTTYRFVGGNSTEPLQMPTRDGPFLGRPKVEWSTMGTGATTGTKLIIGGDFSNYVVVDRLGTTAELIPHLFGATNRFPSGQRGLYVYGRTGAGVSAVNAFRYLEVK